MADSNTKTLVILSNLEKVDLILYSLVVIIIAINSKINIKTKILLKFFITITQPIIKYIFILMRIIMIVLMLTFLFWGVRYAITYCYIIRENFLIFECGYEAFNRSLSKISSHFYKLIIIFIIFDLELIFMVLILKDKGHIKIIRFVCYIILLSLLYEFFIKSLIWEF